ncbi:MAG: Thiamine thiazole synthase [Syntrophus sp. SKADARSKE-3]|nr:Thiamine thiazole synthase [Syntrophus sp. SKADARSKE-3]
MKIAVIGAGPGGLYAALAAARQGMETHLFEKGQVGDGVICGECIFDSLGIMKKPGKGLLHRVDDIVLQAEHTYRLAAGRHRNLWMMDRILWQRDLAEQAVEAGVTLHEGINIRAERYRAFTEDYDWIIDASGAPSVTSRAFGFSGDYFRKFMMAYQVVVSGDFSVLLPAIKAVFLRDLPKEVMPGYYWVFPKDEGTANVGVGCSAREGHRFDVDLKTLLAGVLEREGLSGQAILKKGGGLIPARILPELVYGRVLLVGDAAGLTSPLHGGGIDLACLSGVLAVEAITNGRPGADLYRRRLIGYLREKSAMEGFVIAKMRTLRFEQWDTLLHAAAVPQNILRAKAALQHTDLLLAAWKWLRKKGRNAPPSI